MDKDFLIELTSTYIDRITELGKENEELHKKSADEEISIKALKAMLGERDNKIKELERQLNEKEESIAALNTSFTDLTIANQNLRMGDIQ